MKAFAERLKEYEDNEAVREEASTEGSGSSEEDDTRDVEENGSSDDAGSGSDLHEEDETQENIKITKPKKKKKSSRVVSPASTSASSEDEEAPLSTFSGKKKDATPNVLTITKEKNKDEAKSSGRKKNKGKKSRKSISNELSKGKPKISKTEGPSLTGISRKGDNHCCLSAKCIILI